MPGHQHHKKHHGGRKRATPSGNVESDDRISNGSENGDRVSETGDQESEVGDHVEHAQPPSPLAYEALRDRSPSPQLSDKPPVSPLHQDTRLINGDNKDVLGSPRTPRTPPTEDQKMAMLHDLNDKLVRQVASLRSDRDSLTKKVSQLEEELTAAKEAQEETAALKIEHMNQMKEIFDKTRVIEEENASLKDEASKLNQERVALIEEKDSLSLEKRELDTAVFKLNSKLAEISACIEEAEKMALAEKSKTKEAQEQISTLHKEYSDQISELVGKTRVTEEEISSLREEASKLRQERSVLIDEKNELEVSMSKKIQELEASSCSVAAAEEMASAAKSRENEAKELNVALQREHASKVTELTNRIHELEEESFSSKEEASRLTQQVTVLSKERNSIAVEKNHLESHLEDVQKMAFAAKSRAEELEDELLSLKRDHTKEVQELANKIHVSEEASSTLREESKRLHKDITALIEAKNSLDCEKIDLEAAASRLTSELAASLAQIEDANRLGLASKSEAEEAQEVIAALKTEHTNQMKELANKRQVLEEEISALKEETSSLSKKFTALIEEKDSLSDGNRGLEAAVSRLSMKLEESAANVQEAGKMTTAANLKAEEAWKEIAVLKLEHMNQVQELTSRGHLSEEEINSLKEEVSKLSKEKASLMEEKNALYIENKDLKVTVSELSSKLGTLSAHVEEAESNATVTKSRLEVLEKEIGTLSTGNEILEKEKSYLHAVAGKRAADLEKLNREQELLREELEQVSSVLSKAEEEVTCAKLVIERLHSEEERLEQENGKLARELADQLAHHGEEMDSHTRNFGTKVEGLEATILRLEDDLRVAKGEAAETLQICEMDKEAFSVEVKMLNGKVESLEEELNTARLQAKQLQDTQTKDFAVKVKSLEATISSLQDELQVSKSKPADLLNKSSESTDSSARTQSELATWQEQIKVLNASLKKANFEKDTSDQKAQELASELSSLKISLQLKTKIASYGFPAATASGALAAVGVMAFLKNFRRQ